MLTCLWNMCVWCVFMYVSMYVLCAIMCISCCFACLIVTCFDVFYIVCSLCVMYTVCHACCVCVFAKILHIICMWYYHWPLSVSWFSILMLCVINQNLSKHILYVCCYWVVCVYSCACVCSVCLVSTMCSVCHLLGWLWLPCVFVSCVLWLV